MCLQVEMEEAEPESTVIARQRGADSARVGAAAFENKSDGDGCEGENLRSSTGDEVVEENAENEEERIEELDWSVELGALFKGERWIGGNEEVPGFSASELAEATAGLPESGDEFIFGQSGERAEGEDAPASEGLGIVRRDGEDGERERSKCGSFFAGGDDGGGPSSERGGGF